MSALKQKITQKAKISQTLRSWLPILQSGIEDLKESLEKFAENNPFLSVQESENFSKDSKNHFDYFYKNNTTSSNLEAFSVAKKSVFELLNEQIIPPLFPTQRSQIIAEKIIECLNSQGYFEYEEEIFKEFSKDEVERVRKRFCYLEPLGVGAVDFKEALSFGLENSKCSDEIYDFAKILINDFDNAQNYTKSPFYADAIAILKKISLPPFIEYFEDSRAVVPDIFIYRENNEIKVRINDEYYPELILQTDNLSDDYLTSFIKDAKNLIDALDMRKATLYKIGLMIVEHQYDFFMGGEIRPMTLKDLALDLERNASTISRAISNKYLGCERGVIALKDFFAFALDEETSNASVKDFVANLIKNENPKKPLSDSKLLELVNAEFNIDLGRRTIAKYRSQLNIAGSTDRKILYELEGKK